MRVCAEERCIMIKVNGEVIEQVSFPDQTKLFRFETDKKNIEIQWFYENDSELFELICLTGHIRETFSPKELMLSMPYVPNARMDRVKQKNEVFTLKWFCKIINSLHFDKVEILDVHSNVSSALLDRVVNQSPEPYIRKAIHEVENRKSNENEDQLVLYFPDEGSVKRYAGMFPEYPYCYGMKKRDWKTGKIEGIQVVTNGFELKGKDVMMIDDICSYGGTLYYSSKALKNEGAAEIYSFTSHTENSVLDLEKGTYRHAFDEKLVKKHYTTDSIYRGVHPNIEVIK